MLLKSLMSAGRRMEVDPSLTSFETQVNRDKILPSKPDLEDNIVEIVRHMKINMGFLGGDGSRG